MRKLGFIHYEIVEAIGKSCGLTLIWKEDFNLTIEAKTSTLICGSFFGENGEKI